MRAHAEAVAELFADSDSDLLVYDGEVPTGQGRPDIYVVFYLTAPMGSSRRLSGDAHTHRYLLSTMAVGTSPNECRWAAERARAVLVKRRLDVPGRLCTPFVEPYQRGTSRKDTTVNPPVWVLTETWPFTSSPSQDHEESS